MLALDSIIFSLIILLLLLLATYFKPHYFIEETNLVVRKIHKKSVIKVGGFIVLGCYAPIIYIENHIFTLIYLFSFIVFILGVIDDFAESISGPIRALVLLIISIGLIFFTNLEIKEIELSWIDKHFLNLPGVALVFTSLCLLLISNGFNLIDGQHGLMTGIAIILSANLYFLTPEHLINLKEILGAIISATAILFIFNFCTGRIVSGDCGSNFLGFLIGSMYIYIYNIYYINPYYVASILFYPITEILFSYLRRISEGKNPFSPDDKHLHSILFKLLSKNNILSKLSGDNINRITSLILLSYVLIIIIMVNNFGNLIGYSNFIFINLASYLIFYFTIKKYSRANYS